MTESEVYCNSEPSTTCYIKIITSIFIIMLSVRLYIQGILFVYEMKFFSKVKPVAILYILTFIAWILCFIIGFISQILPVTPKCTQLNPLLFQYLYGITFSLYYISTACSYLLFLYRLKISFMESKEPLSTFMFVVLLLFFIIQFIASVLLGVFGILIQNNIGQTWNIDVLIQTMRFCISIPYFISSLLLVILFVSKSIKLAKNESSKHSLDYNRLKMAVKYLNCSIVMFITTILMSFGSYISFSRAVKVDKIPKVASLYVFLRMMDGALNVFFLHLQFEWMNTCYYCICNPCTAHVSKTINCQLNNINLTITSEKYLDQTDSQSCTAITASSVAPTKSITKSKNFNALEPMSQDPNASQTNTTNNDVYYPVYFCKICPII